MGVPSTFTVADYIIFFGTIVFSVAIGVFFACRKVKKQTTIVDYFLAGRKMSLLPAAMSLVVTYQSSLMVIGNPSEVYSYGMIYSFFVFGGMIAYGFAALAIVPLFHPLKLTSVYRYFQLRYKDNLLRYLVLVFGLIYYILYMSSVTYGTCVALEVIIGIPQWGTILIYTIVTAIYTSIGGMKAVIWTDVLQLIIMMTGVTAILTKSILEVGGVPTTVQIAESRLQLADFRFDPRIRYQFWHMITGSTFIFLIGCFQQPGIQRINTIPDVTTARRLFALAGPLYAVFAFIICSEGVTIFAYYSSKKCDPLESGRIKSQNGIVPLAVSDLFTGMPGLPGLFLASLSSAALSTLSSCLSSLGAVTYDDIIRENFPNLSENTATFISKVTVFLYGIVAMGFTFLISVLPGSIISIALSTMGCFDGPTCGVFLVSMMSRRVTSKAVALGALITVALFFCLNLGRMSSGIVYTSRLPPASIEGCSIYENSSFSPAISFNHSSLRDVTTLPDLSSGQNDTSEATVLETLYSLSFICYPFYGCVLTIILSVLFSYATKSPESVDTRCLFSFREHVYLPLCKKGKLKEFGNDKVDAEIDIPLQNNLKSP